MTELLSLVREHGAATIVALIVLALLVIFVFAKLLGKIIVSVATAAVIAFAVSRGWWF